MKLKRLRTFSFLGLLKYFSLKIRGKSISVTGRCKACGICCQSISLEGPNGWLRSAQDFEKMVNNQEEYRRFEILGKDSQGFLLFRCNKLSSDNTCLDYTTRLNLCKKFPEKDLAFMGGEIPSVCGYDFQEIVPFHKILAREQEKKK